MASREVWWDLGLFCQRSLCCSGHLVLQARAGHCLTFFKNLFRELELAKWAELRARALEGGALLGNAETRVGGWCPSPRSAPPPQVGSQVLSFRTLKDSHPAPSTPGGHSGPQSTQHSCSLCERGPGCLSPHATPPTHTGVAFCSQDHGAHSYSGWGQAQGAPALQGMLLVGQGLGGHQAFCHPHPWRPPSLQLSYGRDV